MLYSLHVAINDVAGEKGVSCMGWISGSCFCVCRVFVHKR